MTRVILTVGLLATTAAATDVDLFGYYEPQYTGTWAAESYRQLMSNRLRVDIKSTVVDHVEFGADIVGLLYHGTKIWNLLDFMPDAIAKNVLPPHRRLLVLQFSDRFYAGDMYARLAFRKAAMTVGKQQLSFGTGYFANPTDIFNAKDAFDPTYEQPGHNALRLDAQPWNRVGITGLLAPGTNWETTTKLVRAKAGIGRFDFSVTGAEFRHTTTDFDSIDPTTSWFFQASGKRRMVGADFVGQVWELGLWAEGALFMPEEGDSYYELIAGIDHTFDGGFYVMAEYHRNTAARADWQEYDLNDWLRSMFGETRTLARDQAYALARYQVTDLLGVGMMGIASISDGSVALVPMLDWNLFENVDLSVMANVLLGDEGKAYGSTLGSGGILRCRVWF
jgi:hypothetical protein